MGDNPLKTQNPVPRTVQPWFIRYVLIGCAVMLGVCALYMGVKALASKPDEIVPVRIGNTTLQLEVADSFWEREKGLMNRTKLEGSDGMLFIFPQAEPQEFWMRNTHIALDMLWVHGGIVAAVTRNVQPEPGVPVENLQRYASPTPVEWVIELPAGTAEKLGITSGTAVAPELLGSTENTQKTQ